MPVRSQKAARTATGPALAYDIPGFDFNQAISWRPGKALPVADLLSRLQSLSNALRSYEEENFNAAIFAPLATDLSNPNLLGHKDKGVRAWSLLCIVDLLRICAPDAPFSGLALKDVFTVFINSILPAMADPGNAYNAQHVYILQSLSESQSIILLGDVPEPDTLITNLFTHAFDIFAPGTNNSGTDSQVSKTVEYHLKNLLCTVVEETELPQDVTDVVLSQFLRVDLRKPTETPSKSNKTRAQDKSQGNLLPKEYPAAYNLAKAICTTCQEKMTAQISQYFNTIIVNTVSAIKSSIDQPGKRRYSALQDSDDESEDLEDLKKAHRLLQELWRACPDVLVNVIPQVEAELSADEPELRQLATETVGDVTAGIGIAGLVEAPRLDPAALPLPSLTQPEAESTVTNPLLIPASPKPFVAVHQSAYENFLTRRNDKAPIVRSSWVTAAARILFTSAGGIGLSENDQSELLSGYAQMLRDQDESVRIAAIRGLNLFSYRGIVTVVGADGGLSKSSSVISTLTERFSDRKHAVRAEAMSFAAQLWGTASRDLADGLEEVTKVLGEMPTRLLRSYYTNDANIHCLLDKVLYESIFPLSFPPMKQSSGSGKKKAMEAEAGSQDNGGGSLDADAIRARRILTFVQALDTRTKQVFFAMQNRQVQMSRAMTVFLKACDDFNGGTVKDDLDEAKVEARLKAYIEALSKTFPDPPKLSADLWKFAKQNNRRDYQLIRYAMNPESDHRTVQKAIKELTKRIRDGPATTQALLDTILQLLYRCALVIYNRSHIPAIMQLSHTNEHGLASVAHEMLKEISARNPEVLKTHIQALCNELGESAPSEANAEDDGAADTLKACAHFARRYPGEVDKDRKFMTALTKFALYSRSPRAAKHAVSIILAVTDRKEMYAKEILSKALKEAKAKPSSPYFLGQLASIGQVCLLSSAAAASETEALHQLAVTETLEKNRNEPASSEKMAKTAKKWEEPVSHETQAKEFALRILVNRCRSENDGDDDHEKEEFETTAKAVLKLLFQLIDEKKGDELDYIKAMPLSQRNHLRLAAGRLVLKLCSHKRRCEELVSPSEFNSLAWVAINRPTPVRVGLVNQLKKYLGHNRLNYRWLTILFLLAFEPDLDLKMSTVKWLRSRGQYLERQQQQQQSKLHQNVMEITFARLLSLLAHHPDFPSKSSDNFDEDLLGFSKYIVFYLVSVATENNLSLIFHIAQRIKQTRDNITSDGAQEGNGNVSERLYVLSDLSQAVIRNYADMMPSSTRGGAQILETWPGQVPLPKKLFKALPNHTTAQAVVEKNYLPEDTALGLEKVIRDYTRSIKAGTASTSSSDPSSGGGGANSSTSNKKQAAKRATPKQRKRKSGSDDDENDYNDDGGEDNYGEDDEAPSRTVGAKKPKTNNLPIRRTKAQPQTKAETAKVKKRKSGPAPRSVQPARKSARVSASVSYAEAEDDSDAEGEGEADEEAEEADADIDMEDADADVDADAQDEQPASRSRSSKRAAAAVDPEEAEDDEDAAKVNGHEGSEDEDEDEDEEAPNSSPPESKGKPKSTPKPKATTKKKVGSTLSTIGNSKKRGRKEDEEDEEDEEDDDDEDDEDENEEEGEGEGQDEDEDQGKKGEGDGKAKAKANSKAKAGAQGKARARKSGGAASSPGTTTAATATTRTTRTRSSMTKG